MGLTLMSLNLPPRSILCYLALRFLPNFKARHPRSYCLKTWCSETWVRSSSSSKCRFGLFRCLLLVISRLGKEFCSVPHDQGVPA